MREAIPEAAIREWLTESEDRVILRNADFAVHLAGGGDIDVLVGDFVAASRSAVGRFGVPIAVSKWSYVTGHLWQWGLIDMLPRLEWHGIEYLSPQDVFDAAVQLPGGERIAHPAHEAVVCWIGKLLWGGAFPDKYRDVITSAAIAHPHRMADALTYAVGRRWATRLMDAALNGQPELSAGWVRPLRCAVRLQGVSRGPARALSGWIAHWRAWVHVHREPPMPWLGFLGLDGSGKTTVISEITQRLTDRYWLRGVRIGHWSPGKLRTSGGEAQGPVTDPHGKPLRGLASSIAKLLYLMADWWIGYWTDLVRYRREHVVLIFDRHFVDMLIDRRRYRYGGPLWLARAVARLIPSPDLFVLLDVRAEVAHERKPEIPLEAGRQLRSAYLALAAGDGRFVVIDATRRPDDVIDEVEREIIGFCLRRTETRMPWLLANGNARESGTNSTSQLR